LVEIIAKIGRKKRGKFEKSIILCVNLEL
jgi:hypothetical protein